MQSHDTGQQLMRVVYTSIHGGIGERARLSLSQEAAELNAKRSIAGILVVGEEDFLGVIEGTPIVVTTTLLNIARDHRHHSMNILCAETLKVRMCDDWKVLNLAELGESERCLVHTMVTAAVGATRINSVELAAMISALVTMTQGVGPRLIAGS